MFSSFEAEFYLVIWVEKEQVLFYEFVSLLPDNLLKSFDGDACIVVV